MNIIGRRFGRLVVTGISRKTISSGREIISWKCSCRCGGKTTTSTNHLTSGHTSSCGCLRYERLLSANLKHGHTKNGRVSPEYRVWQEMVRRCAIRTHIQFKDYGGRGITVCSRWQKSFMNFFIDMGPRPTGMLLDRKNNDKGYSRSNCRWVTPLISANNRRTSRIIKHRGLTLTMSQWAKRLSLPGSTLCHRLDTLRWPLKKALQPHVR